MSLVPRAAKGRRTPVRATPSTANPALRAAQWAIQAARDRVYDQGRDALAVFFDQVEVLWESGNAMNGKRFAQYGSHKDLPLAGDLTEQFDVLDLDISVDGAGRVLSVRRRGNDGFAFALASLRTSLRAPVASASTQALEGWSRVDRLLRTMDLVNTMREVTADVRFILAHTKRSWPPNGPTAGIQFAMEVLPDSALREAAQRMISTLGNLMAFRNNVRRPVHWRLQRVLESDLAVEVIRGPEAVPVPATNVYPWTRTLVIPQVNTVVRPWTLSLRSAWIQPYVGAWNVYAGSMERDPMATLAAPGDEFGSFFQQLKVRLIDVMELARQRSARGDIFEVVANSVSELNVVVERG